MRVALIQFASDVDNAHNRAVLQERLAALPATDDIDLVVLPEASMHDFGSADHDLAAPAETLDGPFVRLLGEHARRLGATIVAGMFEKSTADEGTADKGTAGTGIAGTGTSDTSAEPAPALPWNTLAVVGPAGALAAGYRKVHLYDSFGYRESDRLAAGDVAPVVLPGGIGLMTCYDLRFPELARLLVDAGARLIVLPAAWVAGDHKLDHWRTLVRARAIENVCWVVACAQSAPRYTGHSLVVDPWGSIVVEAGDGDDTVFADLDESLVDRVREVNPSLANRRIHPT